MDDNRDVELRFPPVPGHVRTARLVAVAVARRARLDDIRLDEVRLAVGEACARAVRRSLRSGDPRPIVLILSDDLTDLTPGLRAEVWDDAPPAHGDDEEDDAPPVPGGGKEDDALPAPGDDEGDPGEDAEVDVPPAASGDDEENPGGDAEVEVPAASGDDEENPGEDGEVNGGAGTTSAGAPAGADEAGDDAPDDAVVIALLTGLADRVEVLDGTGGPGGRVRMTWTHRPKRTKAP